MKQYILVIDDEPQMLKLLERILKEMTCYGVDTTSNSLEVPRILDRKAYDVIITDLKMPGMDGMDILRLLKERNRQELAVMITAFGSLETAQEALKLGVCDYITKPFTKGQIIDCVEGIMERQRLRHKAYVLQTFLEKYPCAAAVAAFTNEYVRYQAQRHNGDIAALAEQIQLSEAEIHHILEKPNA